MIGAVDAASGELIAGKYRVVRKLGGGGMADVFLANVEGAAGFSRQVVIKRLLPALARDDDSVAMFLDEARIAARLHHANIAQVFDFGNDASGYFLAMEFLAGRDARAIIRGAGDDGVPLAIAVAIASGAAAGLDHAHRQSADDGSAMAIVHRDVTSSNVFVTLDGAVKLIDFGIARAAVRVSKTKTGYTKGTVPYMSPEQASGDPVDGRSDLFQLGVVLYELVTGRRPFDREGDTELEIMQRICGGEHAPPSTLRGDCPPDLDALIARLLATSPSQRPPTGDALITELDAIARRYGWSTSPHELGRYVGDRGLDPAAPSPAPPSRIDDAAPTVADVPRARGTPSSPPATGDILAGLAAPRHTAPIEEQPAPTPSPQPSPQPRRARLMIAIAVAIVAISVTVAVLRTMDAPATRSTTTATEPSRPPADVDLLADDVAHLMPGSCLREARGQLDQITVDMETNATTLRKLRISLQVARMMLRSIENPVVAKRGESCRGVENESGYREELQRSALIDAELAERERAKHYAFDGQEDSGRLRWRDLRTGNQISGLEVDAR